MAKTPKSTILELFNEALAALRAIKRLHTDQQHDAPMHRAIKRVTTVLNKGAKLKAA